MIKDIPVKSDKSAGLMILIGLISFILIFTYLSLNLKNIDSGYEIQELNNRQKKLREEIDKLQSRKASLLNLQRVEEKVMRELGYQYPEPGQFIKVFEEQK